jgi:hypothetical protein
MAETPENETNPISEMGSPQHGETSGSSAMRASTCVYFRWSVGNAGVVDKVDLAGRSA